jgi:hypothetical protein
MRLQQDIVFERQQLFRTSGEQEIASRLRPLGLGADSAEASFMRLTQTIRQVGDTSGQVFTGLLEGLQSGASGADILRGALGTVQSALNSVLSDMLKAGLMRGLSSALGGAMGGGGLGGAMPGDFDVSRIGDFSNLTQLHSGGMVGSEGTRRNLFREPMRHNEQLAVLEEDEAVLTPAQQRALARRPVMMPGGGGNDNRPIVVNFEPKIVNNTPARVTATDEDDGRGGRRPVIMIDEAVANVMRQPGSESGRAVSGVGRLTRR